MVNRFPAQLTAALFDWIPYVAVLVSVGSVAAAIVWGPKGAEEFSRETVTFSVMAAVLQLSVTIAFWRAQDRLSARFPDWVKPPRAIPAAAGPEPAPEAPAASAGADLRQPFAPTDKDRIDR